MADVPTPRSYNSVLSDIISSFLSKLKLGKIKVGGPILSIMEAAAQSDIRSSQDVFNLLNTQSIDRATGVALDNIAADENLTRTPVTAASGLVNFLDTSFEKISTNVYQGASAPNIGTIVIKVADASNFPTKGSIYIGRNTINYEGPLTYNTSGSNPPVDTGPYWTITLDVGTNKFHNLGESVILAQGGVRLIPANTSVQTPQGNVSDAITFSTLYNSQIEDGEVIIENVEVIADQPGIVGNVPAAGIKEVNSAPYKGAGVTNPLPFNNGLAAQDDDSLRETIKNVRQSRAKGTNLALTTGVKGVTSKEDNKTVISSSVVNRQNNEVATLYIDDGTGYEETTAGIAQETLMDSALGGEQLFQLSSQRPVTKAFVTSILTAPFSLTSGDILAVYVNGIRSEHSFNSSEFKSISNATSYEIVSSINGNPNLLFNARTTNNGNNVTIFAKADIREDIQVTTPSDGNNANDAIGFSTELNYTLRLYKNDVFLYKDGKYAIVTSNSQNTWSSSITSGDTLLVIVDNTSTQTLTFTDSDFINNDTGFTTVNASNTLEAWATVFNAKLTGVTAVGENGVLTLTSNKGTSSKAKIEITGGTLITKGMFTVASGISEGQDSDYTLDRNTAQLKLRTPLVEGDTLVAATPYTRAYTQSEDFPSASITLASTANLYFSVDENAEIINTGITAATPLTITNPAGFRARYTGASGIVGSGSTAFIRKGDWVVIWDPQFTEKGIYRVSDVDVAPFAWFEVERSSISLEIKTPTSLGIVFVRSVGQLQNIQIPSGTYSLSAITDQLNEDLIGAEGSLFRNTKLRVNTNTYGPSGDIMLVTADIEGQKLALEIGTLYENNPSHFAVIESGNSESGSPGFDWTTVATTPTSTTFTLTNTPSTIGLDSGHFAAFRKRLNGYGADSADHMVISDISTSNIITVRTNSKTNQILVNDRVYSASPFAFSGEDNISIILDKDNTTKNFDINLYRNIKPDGAATYGASPFEVDDVDNLNQSLWEAFGDSTIFFNDYALFMHARGKSHSPTANKTILWRDARYGVEGENAKIAFINPSAANQPISLTTNTLDGNSNINIVLPSSAERTGLNINGDNAFIVTSNKSYTATSGNVSRTSNVVTVTLAAAGVTNTHTLSIGDTIYQTTTIGTFPAGPKTVTAIGGNTFSYAETAANSTSGASITYVTSKLPAGTTYTVTGLSSTGTVVTATVGSHLFAIGDTVYLRPGHFDSTSGITITPGAKTVTAITATEVKWNEVTVAGTATLVAGVAYRLSSGQCQKVTVVYSKAEVAIGALSRTSGIVTATINTTPIVTTHPFAVGDIVYLSPGEALFTAGAKIITSITSTTFSYVEAGTNGVSTVIQYFTKTSSDINLTGGGTPVIVGHIAHISTASNLDNDIAGDFRVATISSTNFSFYRDSSYAGNSIPTALGTTADLIFYPINAAAATATLIATWINTNANDIVTATLVPNNSGTANAGTAQVATASLEEFFLTTTNSSINGAGNASVYSWSLFDGLNFIKTTNLSATDSKIGLKEPVSAELSLYSDFTNETMRLVPITVNNLVGFLGSPSVSGFASNALVQSSSDGDKLQLGSSTIGSTGAIQITGGTGNFTSASVVGTGEIIGNYSKVVISSGQLKGFTGNQTVSIQGNSSALKLTPFISTTSMAIVTGMSATNWKIQLTGSGTTAVNVIQAIGSGVTYQIEKHGKFMAYVDVNLTATLSSSINEGDWVYINNSTMSATNTGIRQVVRVDIPTGTFWVENESGVEETIVTASGDFIKFITYDSVMPGDTLTINTSILGTNNIGNFVVSGLSESGVSTTANEFYVTGELTAQSATPLGSDYIFIQVKEKTPIRLIKKIRAINQNTNNSNYYDIIFDTSSYGSKISNTVESIISPLDKLDFGTDTIVGLDGYSYNTGLIAEVNRVVYGDEFNSAVYPGILAQGANLNISGPLVKRVQVSLSLRLRTGVSSRDVSDRVKSAVASLINSINVGESIAISDIVASANAIDGVLAVTILSPVYTSGSDLIPVQANEKTRVLDIETDILVSIVS